MWMQILPRQANIRLGKQVNSLVKKKINDEQIYKNK